MVNVGEGAPSYKSTVDSIRISNPGKLTRSCHDITGRIRRSSKRAYDAPGTNGYSHVMVTSGSNRLKLLVLAAAMSLASLTNWISGSEIQQALIWLPSGVAIAGLAIIGWRAVWVVALTIALQRMMMGRGVPQCLSAALATSLEALFGAWLVHAFHIRRGLDRLRDVMALYVVSLCAPLASIASTLITRQLFLGQDSTFHGMTGWWRMNAIGILIGLPVVMSWPVLAKPRDWLRPLGQASLWGIFAGAIAGAVVVFGEPGMSSVMLFGAVPMISFAAALHMGNRGSATAALVGALVITIPASHAIGPFEGIPVLERHIVAQILLVSLAAVSPMFGALLAERDANAARWLQSEGVGNALLRILPDATYRLRLDGMIVDAVMPQDPELPRASELIGKHLSEVVDAAVCERILLQLERLQRGEPTETIEYQLKTPSGFRDREVRFVQLPTGDAMSVARDITERKRAERQLTMQANILEMIAAGKKRTEVFRALAEGTERLVSDGRISIMMLHGDRLYTSMAPSLPADYLELIEGLEIGVNHGACGTAAATAEVVICADVMTDREMADYREIGRQFDLLACWSVPILSSDGSVLGTFAIYHDHPRAPQPFEIALIQRAAVLAGLMIDRERREGLLASIHRNVNEGLFRSIPGDGFVYATASLAKLFGYESANDLRETWHLSDNESHRTCLEQLANQTMTERSQKRLLYRRDGSEFWALISTSVTFEDNDNELICDGTVIDITQHKELEDQLRQSQKMDAVGQLAGGVAHDFNNLLTAISGFAETVDMQLPQSSKLRGDIQHILSASKRAATLTRQLLAFGRRQVLSPEVLDVHDAVVNVTDLACRLIGQHIELVIVPSTDSVRAEVDRGQLEQVLLNLVINSRDAMSHGGRITIETTTETFCNDNPHPELEAGKYAVLRVRDDGEGMSCEVQARAFEPFFTTKELGVGTGLGLATVYGIVKQSGGTVVIDSELGHGTTVSVFLPFVTELPRPERQVPVPRIEHVPGTILVVEDEPVVLELTQRTLAAAGHTVLVAKDGREALEVFAEHKDEIDLVLTDIVMPKIGGATLGAEIHAMQPSMRIMFMSGYARDAIDLPRDIDLRSAFLHKPFTTDQLKEQVAMMLSDSYLHQRDAQPPTETKTT